MNLLPEFQHARPTTIDEAVELLDEGSMPYHGGTELLAVMRIGLLRPGRLVDLKHVEDLAGITYEDGVLSIGGGVTHRQLGLDSLVAEHAPLLRAVARVVGNVRVRASGTVGGNLCFAEPKSDLATVLIALDGRVVLRSVDGQRSVSVDEFLLGAYVSDRAPGELLIHTDVAVQRVRQAVYRKFQTAERPTVGVAIALRADEPKCRVVVGAVGERPEIFDVASVADVDPRGIADTVDVVPDLAGAEDYKRHVTAVTVMRALEDLRTGNAA